MSSRDRAYTGHGSLASRSQVINTAGLHNDYTFLSGLQAQEIRLGSPDRFPRERCGLGTRLGFSAVCADLAVLEVLQSLSVLHGCSNLTVSQ